MKIFCCRRGCDAIFLLIVTFAFFSAPTPTQGQGRSTVTQNQIERVLKRFKTSVGVSYDAKLKEILDCLSLNLAVSSCSDLLRDLVTDAILLRDRMREMGEDCTSVGKYRNPFGANYIFNYRVEEYSRFQKELLDTGLVFCNPFKHLYCSPQRKCECRPGTVLKPEVNPEVCTLEFWGYCESKHSLFDPFNSDQIDQDSANAIQIPALTCPEGKNGRCRFAEYFLDPVCANDAILELNKKLANHFKDLPRLSSGDPCNFEHHEELLKEADYVDYRIRMKKLEEILGAKTKLCDLGRLVVCGNSRKCECISPTLYDENKKMCTFKRAVEFCIRENENIIEELGTRLRFHASKELKNGYQNARLIECKGGCNVYSIAGRPDQLFCTICNSHDEIVNIGRYCNKTIASFLARRMQIALPSDEDDYGKQLDLLDELSDKATELEKIQVLDEGSLCDLEGELEAVRAIRKIKNVEVDLMVATKAYYRETIRVTDEVIQKYGSKGLCKYPERVVVVKNPSPGSNGNLVIVKIRPDLVCGPTATNSTCYKLKNDEEYLETLRKRLLPFKTLSDGQPCIFDPEFVIQDAHYRIPPFLRLEGFYKDLFVQFENHFVNKTQFCNTKSGLDCDFDSRKCSFSDEMKKKNMMNKTKNPKDLQANGTNLIHISIIVILFPLTAVFFI